MKKTSLFIIYFIFGITLAHGQVSSTQSEEKRPAIVINNIGGFKASVPNELSIYFGYDNKIKEITIDNNIPDKFPTRQRFADKTTYLTYANEWLKAHQSIIRPEFKNTVLKD